MKAVIFDIYGTLIWSKRPSLCRLDKYKDSQITALGKISVKYEITVPAEVLRDELMKEIDIDHEKLKQRGITYPEIRSEEVIGRIFDRHGVEVDPKAFFLDYYMEYEQTRIDDSAKELLIWFKDNGIFAGILSNAQYYTEIDMLRQLEINKINELFDPRLIYYSCQYNISKPEERFYKYMLDGMRKLNIRPEDSLFVGNDMRNDIAATKKYGFITCLAVNKETIYNDDTEPDYQIKKILEIRDIIKNENTDGS